MLSSEEKKQPNHLVAIPDGNRRWARERGLVPYEGHNEGIKRFHEVKDAAFRAGISYFTFWATSYDNLTKRSRIEVRVLVSNFKKELKSQLKSKQYEKDETRVRIRGLWREVIKDKSLYDLADELEKKSSAFSKHNLTILFGYDGKREMIKAIEKLKKDRAGELDYEKVKNALWTGDLPPVDFIIRTGGEPHWSAGFMMWLASDSQLYFTETYWPSFGEKELKKALLEYSKRGRRFGA